MKLSEAIVQIATKEIGVTEVNGTNCGPRVDEYKAATWLNPKLGWPWCAAFVCWCFREALALSGAWDFENWSLAQDNTTNTRKPHKNDIQAGDIVIFTFSHIGIAISAPDKNRNIRVIEGNTDGAGSREGGAVLRKTRHVSRIRSRIRINA
jgi:hypothetical protein